MNKNKSVSITTRPGVQAFLSFRGHYSSKQGVERAARCPPDPHGRHGEQRMALASCSTALFSRCWKGLEPPPRDRKMCPLVPTQGPRASALALKAVQPVHGQEGSPPGSQPAGPGESLCVSHSCNFTESLQPRIPHSARHPELITGVMLSPPLCLLRL